MIRGTRGSGEQMKNAQLCLERLLASNTCQPKHQGQGAVDCEKRGVVNSADAIADAAARHGNDLIHHDLGHFAQPVFRRGA